MAPSIVLPFKNNSKKENVFLAFIFLLFATLCFFIPSFSALSIFNYVTIAIVAVLCILILTWKVMFHKVLIDRFFVCIVAFNIAILVSNFFNKDASHIITYATLSGMSFCLYQFFLERKYRYIIRIIVLIAFSLFALYFFVCYRTKSFTVGTQFNTHI